MSYYRDNNNNAGSMKQKFQNIKASTMANAETKIKEKFEELTPILTKAQLKNLDQHKYSSSGKTALDPMFQPFWNWLVLQMPLSLAPNAITIIGLIINVVTCTILMLYSPNADQDVSFLLFLLLPLAK